MSDNKPDSWEIEEDISLESILAEYKGEAFIEGQKKTPKKVLDQAADRILDETLDEIRKMYGLDQETEAEGRDTDSKDNPSQPLESDDEANQQPSAQPEAVQPAPIQKPAKPKAEAVSEPEDLPEPQEADGVNAPADWEEKTFGLEGHDSWLDQVPEPQETMPPKADAQAEPQLEKPGKKERKPLEPGKVIQIPMNHGLGDDVSDSEPEPREEKPRRSPISFSKKRKQDMPEPVITEFTDSDQEITDYHTYAHRDSVQDYAQLNAEDSEDAEKESGGFFSALKKRLTREGEDELSEEREELKEEPEGSYDEEDFIPDDISLMEAAGKYGKGINKYHIRGISAIMLSLVMLLINVRGEGGASLPGILGSVQGVTAGLLVLQLLTMLLALEVIVTGVLDVIRLRMGAETLITVAALASIIDAAIIIYTGNADRGLTYAPVVSFALGCGMLGIKATRNAIKTTLRTAAAGASPYVVTSNLGALEEGYVLFKSRRVTQGFVRKTEQMDFSEYIYSMAAPLLIVMSVVFSLLSAVAGGGEIGHFIHNFAAMTMVSASFTGLINYGLPYSRLAKRLGKTGAALAGWGGAAEAGEAVGIVVTDTDVFPAGTLSLSGVRVFRKTDTQRIISYTGSLIAASGSGLTEVFTDIIRKQKYSFYPVEDLASYEGGGIGAKVNGEEIIVGSASFMNLMGIRLPQNLNVKNAVFTAMKGELVGVFAINYVPINSVQEALVNLLHTKIQPLFAVRDFNVTPLMLQNKFNISTDKIDFLTYEQRYALSSLEPDERARPFAVLCREGLGPLADVVVGGKRLRWIVSINTILSLASSVIGLLLMLSFFWAGSPATASAANVFFYLAAWLVVIIALSRLVISD